MSMPGVSVLVSEFEPGAATLGFLPTNLGFFLAAALGFLLFTSFLRSSGGGSGMCGLIIRSKVVTTLSSKEAAVVVTRVQASADRISSRASNGTFDNTR